jgi:hypothetical protein
MNTDKKHSVCPSVFHEAAYADGDRILRSCIARRGRMEPVSR